jgi:hypothetical protein
VSLIALVVYLDVSKGRKVVRKEGDEVEGRKEGREGKRKEGKRC